MSELARLLEGAIGAYVSRPNEDSERQVLELLTLLPPEERLAAYRTLLRIMQEQQAQLDEATSPPLRTAVVVQPSCYPPNGRSSNGDSPGGERADEAHGGGNGHAPLAMVRMLPGGAQALCAVVPGLELEIGDLVAVTSDGGAIIYRITKFQGGEIGSVVRVKEDTGEIVLRGLNEDELVVTATTAVLTDPQLKRGSKVRYGRSTEIATLVEAGIDARSDSVIDTIPDLDWSYLGGMEEIKRQFLRVERQLLAAGDELQEYRLSKRLLFLLTGPAGTGKTLCGKLLAASLRRQLGDDKVVFIIRRADQDLSPLVGVTEANIRSHFDRARALAEQGYVVVVIYDEFEGLFPHRGHSPFSTMVERSLPNVLLGELDGMSRLENFVMFALTNRPDLIDPAILRDRRLGRQIEFRAPDWPESEEIFRIHLQDRVCAEGLTVGDLAERGASRIFTPQNTASGSPAVVVVRFDDGRTEEITRAQMVTGALIESVCDAAAEEAWLRDTQGGPRGITVEDVVDAVDAAFDKFPSRIRETNIMEYVSWPRDKARRVEAVEPPAQTATSRDRIFVEAA